jgi:type VI protein secretion system component VasF
MNTIESSAAAPQPDDYAPAEIEHQFHHYTGNRIPWYVRLLWVLFWIFAVYYTLSYLFPALRIELITPP